MESQADAASEGSAPVDVARQEDEDVVRFAHATLRENLHLTVNSVVSARFRDPRVREALTDELLAALDAVVDDHIAAEEMGRDMRSEADSSGESTGSVEGAMDTLKERLHTLLEGSRPGIKQGASAAMKLAPQVAASLREFVHDDVKFGQAQMAATTLVSRYLHPVIARQVVSFAANAARRATPPMQKKEEAEGEGEQPSGEV